MLEFLGAIVLTAICFYPGLALCAMMFLQVGLNGWESLTWGTTKELFWDYVYLILWLAVSVGALWLWWEVVGSNVSINISV